MTAAASRKPQASSDFPLFSNFRPGGFSTCFSLSPSPSPTPREQEETEALHGWRSREFPSPACGRGCPAGAGEGTAPLLLSSHLCPACVLSLKQGVEYLPARALDRRSPDNHPLPNRQQGPRQDLYKDSPRPSPGIPPAGPLGCRERLPAKKFHPPVLNDTTCRGRHLS